MNKKKKLRLLAGLVLTSGLCLTGCSDNTMDPSISLPDGVPSEVTLDCGRALKSIPIDAIGDWTATVEYDGVADPEEAIEWIGLLDDSGSGKSTLDFVADANNSSRFRSSRIILTAGDKRLEYRVGQQAAGLGEDNANIDMSMFGGQIPLGFGIRMQKPATGDDNVINMLLDPVYTLDGFAGYETDSRLKKYVDAFNLNPQSYVRMDTIRDVRLELVSKEAAEAHSRLIGANLKVNIAYGLFKLNLNGNFRMFGASNSEVYTFSALSNPNKGTIAMNETRLNNDLEDLEPVETDDAQTAKDRAAARKLLMSNSFIKIHDEIEKCVAEGQTYQKGTNNKLYKKMVALNNNFGPAYVRSAEVGASAELVYNFTKSENQDTLKIHGDLTIGVNSLLSLDVSAAADYNNYIKSHISETSFQYRIRGGSPVVAIELGNSLAKLMSKGSGETISPTVVTEKIGEWAKSVSVSSPSNVTCINYYPTPIWNLFSEYAQEELMHFFWDMYPNNQNGDCPYTFDIRRQIEGLGYNFDN